MKFYCLHEGFYESVRARLSLLEAACRVEKVEFCPLDSKAVDYSNLPRLHPGDLLYNCARGSETLESLLLSDVAVSFYISRPAVIATPVDPVDSTIVHCKAGLPGPKTIFDMTGHRDRLSEYVQFLGGFPLILKARAGTRGVGTIRVDSWPNLLSTVDFVLSSSARFIMRQYIPNNGTARLVVLGDRVIASEFRDNLANDFRVSATNGEINYYPREFDPKCDDLAIAATRLANVESAGVDIVLDEAGTPFLLEINAPHNFVAPQQVTGVDIARLMVKWLRDKSVRTFSI